MLPNERAITQCIRFTSPDGVVELVHLRLLFPVRRHFARFRSTVEPRVRHRLRQQFLRHQHRPLRLHGRAWLGRIGGRAARGSDEAPDDVFRRVSGGDCGLGAGGSLPAGAASDPGA